ncbi:MAG: hypothetical protein AB2L20_19070 [Mangrovibacterium sp.]
MKRHMYICLTALVTLHLCAVSYAQEKEKERKNVTTTTEGQLSDNVLPVQACWFWGFQEFKSEGYKHFIDQVSLHSPYTLVSLIIRRQERETITDFTHDRIKQAVEYGLEKGIRMVADLDIRTARRYFHSLYPDEQQEMLLLKEINVGGQKNEAVIGTQELGDHYGQYPSLYGTFLRAYSYTSDAEGIDSGSLKDITANCFVVSSAKDSVRIHIPETEKNKQVCLMVSFTYLYPDIFAPHFMEFQREIIHKYSDVPLAGVFRDEWGFPPCYEGSPAKEQYWYSSHRAKAYSERTGGRDLLADCLLMYKPIKGKERERQMAINHFMEMSWQRNGALEDDYYHTVKKVFGLDAAVTTHPTWWPYPDLREQMKNGLDWWVATRDWAQTDEYTPFAVRTALSKKWGSPVWYNMFYSSEKSDYEKAVWSSALAAGRINYHPVYPSKDRKVNMHLSLLQGDLMQAENRVRLLNFISKSPLDCPVAVVFGHSCTMNWAGPAYDDVGMKLVERLWKEGIPTDLIPSTEIGNKSLVVDKEGWVRYGKQKYAAVILYHPEYERSTTADFFNQAAPGESKLFRTGDWTKDFETKDFDGNKSLPESMNQLTDIDQLLAQIKLELKKNKIKLQTPAIESADEKFGHPFVSPPTTGFCRLVDGTYIQVAGTNNVAGDPICSTVKIQGHPVTFDAIGLAAVKLDRSGQPEAIAAGGLKFFKAGHMKINLDQRVDLALWKNSGGEWEGVIQGLDGNIPQPLLLITKSWKKIMMPISFDE